MCAFPSKHVYGHKYIVIKVTQIGLIDLKRYPLCPNDAIWQYRAGSTSARLAT